MIGPICKAVKSLHLEKLQILQNINNLMFLVIFIFSDWILIKQVTVFSISFWNKFLKSSAWSFEWGTRAWVKIPRFNAFSRNANTINLKNLCHTWSNVQFIKIRQAFWREIKPWGVLKNIKRCILEANLSGQGAVNNTVYRFIGSNLRVKIFLKEKEHQKKGALKIEGWGTSAHFVSGFQKNSMQSPSAFL